MSSLKRAKMSRTGIAARFVTPLLLRLNLHLILILLLLPSSVLASLPLSLARYHPPIFSHPSPPCYRGPWLIKKGKLLKDKMQSLYSQVSVYELPFAFRAHWNGWFFSPWAFRAVQLEKPVMLACYCTLRLTWVPTTSANRGTRHLNRCISPLDCILGDVMHFFFRYIEFGVGFVF